MGRRKIEIRAIKDDRNRSVTFLKRKGGLFKKAHELSVLCSVDVAVIIFGHNTKLYEFSSGDIGETLRRYHFSGPAHEHKGPNDFKNKGGGGDDDDDEDEDEDVSNAREESMPPQQPLMPPHLQHPNSYPHLRQPAASASPPMPNGMFQHRGNTPQPPQMGSRPSSRNQIRRMSSTLVPLQHPHATPPPPPQNGYAYAPNPPVYVPMNQPHPPHQPHPSPQPQFQQFQQHAPPPQQPRQTVQEAHQAFVIEQRRQSQPQPQRQDSLQPPPAQPPQRTNTTPQPETQSLKPPDTTSPPQPRHISSKSRSIFTPIEETGSVLAGHFFSAPDRGRPKNESPPQPKPSPLRNSNAGRFIPKPPQRTPSNTSDFTPLSRTNTGGARPKLNLQIPSEASDAESDSGSPQQSGHPSSANPRSESHHSSGIVLPPPSPSASAYPLSAGAAGPGNPFARPAPPTSNNNNNSNSNSNHANVYNDGKPVNNNLDAQTPMSALPSKYAGEFLPSPNSFFHPDWFGGAGLGGGRGPDSAMLPSPLTFPTPLRETAGPGFGFPRGSGSGSVGGNGNGNGNGGDMAPGGTGGVENLSIANAGDKRKGSGGSAHDERLGDTKKLKT